MTLEPLSALLPAVVDQLAANRGEPTMKALTIRQPWAWAIAAGHKTIENRSRPTKHRGPLAIHAGSGWAPAGGTDARVMHVFRPFATDHELTGIDRSAHPGQLVAGAVIATATVVDCHMATGTCCKPWGDDELYHWVLADVTALDVPIPAKGRLGLWDVNLPVVAA